MAEGFETVLVEPGRVGAINAKNRGIPNVVCATTAEAGFREGSIGAIGLFDVVEHIADDREFVASMRSLLCPGGRLYVTVPAYSHLWSTEDEHAGHYRRYSRAAIEAVLRQCGFSVEYSTYIFRPLPVPVFLARTLPYRLKIAPARDAARDVERDHKPANELVRGAVAAALSGEVKNIERRRRMRFGGSVLLVATATQA